MSPTELRARILVTLGLPASLVVVVPACGGSKPPETPIVRNEADAGASLPVAVDPPEDAPACPMDHAPERICGAPASPKLQPYPFEACPPTAMGLRQIVTVHMLSTGPWRGRENVPFAGGNGFTFDADQTEAEVKRELRGQALVRGTYQSTVCCYVHCAPLEVAREPDPVPPGSRSLDVCIPSPRSTSVPAPRAASCPSAVRIEGVMLGFKRAKDGECCYDKPSPECGPNQWRTPNGECHYQNRGRPLREGGGFRLAPTRRGAGWANAPTRDDVREEVAEAWARAAAAEHSSVAAFAKLSLELLALGAPPELVRDCHAAAIEEVDHAARSYAIASRFAGAPLGPGPLPMAFEAPAADLVRLLAETFADGCVAETVAALEAEEARSATEDPEIREALEVIARDEASHATFAFRLVAWALREGGLAAREALEAGVRAVERELAGAAPRGGVHVSFGMLDEASLVAVRQRALREVVLPCARTLLAA